MDSEKVIIYLCVIFLPIYPYIKADNDDVWVFFCHNEPCDPDPPLLLLPVLFFLPLVLLFSFSHLTVSDTNIAI